MRETAIADFPRWMPADAGIERYRYMNIAILMAGGDGRRMQSEVPKQFLKINGRTLLSYSLEVMLQHPYVDSVEIVAQRKFQAMVLAEIRELYPMFLTKFHGFAEPGKTRQLSVFNALHELEGYAKDDDFIILQDASRPLVSENLVTNTLMGARGHDGAIAMVPVKDPVFSVASNGRTVLKRAKGDYLGTAQTPEVFLFGKYLEANRDMDVDTIMSVEDAAEPALFAGLDIVAMEGKERNFNVATQRDLKLFMKYISRKGS